jgi:hypothetical protein
MESIYQSELHLKNIVFGSYAMVFPMHKMPMQNIMSDVAMVSPDQANLPVGSMFEAYCFLIFNHVISYAKPAGMAFRAPRSSLFAGFRFAGSDFTVQRYATIEQKLGLFVATDLL